jgi:XTP/dITP diphosphohydrolase
MPPMRTVVLATANQHKASEIRAILPGPFQYLTLRDLPQAPALPEDGHTFADNAAQKSLTLARWLVAHRPEPVQAALAFGLAVLADDSGLEVDALGGAPGVHSAQFAHLETGAPGNSTDADNNAKLLRLLAGLPLHQRAARFRCVLAWVEVIPPDHVQPPLLFEGACEGHIAPEPRGQAGFGYDPLFVPVGYQQTFAELGESIKNNLSHRRRALDRLAHYLASRVSPSAPPP